MLLYRKMVGSGLKDVVLSPWEVRLGLPLLGSPAVSSNTPMGRYLMCLLLCWGVLLHCCVQQHTNGPDEPRVAVLPQGMWHVFQASLEVPEAQEAAQEMAKFFRQHLQ